MANASSKKINRVLRAAVALFALIAAWAVLDPELYSTATNHAEDTVGQQRKSSKPTEPRRTHAQRIDYSRFTHRSAAHARQSCDSCHKFPSANWKEVRKSDEAFADVTDFPQHSSCLQCHREQFYASAGPSPVICSVCHIKVTPRNSERFAFPSLGPSARLRQGQETDFAVNFPHEIHADVIGSLTPDGPSRGDVRFTNASFQKQPPASKNEICATCHQTYQPIGKSDDEFATIRPKGLPDEVFWLKKGTFKTVPSTHASCFTCHSMDSGIKPASSDCNVCHKMMAPGEDLKGTDFDSVLGGKMSVTDAIILSRWSRRESSGTFPHEGGMHADLECKSCHNVALMNTADKKTLKVPVISCGGGGTGCHITATADDGGILNFEIESRKTKPDFQCTKCHISLGTGLTPESHASTLAKTQTK